MNRGTLDPATADKLAKILGMLGSDHDGERAAAGLKANQLLRDAGLTWRDVIIAPPIAPDPPRIRAWRSEDNDWQKMAHFCHAQRWRLSSRDREFVASMLRWRGTPTEKQQRWLVDLFVELGGGRDEAAP